MKYKNKTSITALLVAILALALIVSGCSSSSTSSSKTEYQYITADELKAKIEANEELFIIDIQVEEEFANHFIKNAIPTYAYPVETVEDRAKLATTVTDIKTSNAPVIIVCPRGGGGATRTFDFYMNEFIAADRLYILTDGQDQWPHSNLLGDIDNPNDIRIFGTSDSNVDKKPATKAIEEPKEVVLQYVAPEQVKADIESNADIFLLDIQPESDFRKHHIQGAIATYAFPVSSNDDKQKLARVLPDLLTSQAPVYILCPRGRSGADNTFHFLVEQGVENDRLFIIEGGQAGWPYDELVVKN